MKKEYDEVVVNNEVPSPSYDLAKAEDETSDEERSEERRSRLVENAGPSFFNDCAALLSFGRLVYKDWR